MILEANLFYSFIKKSVQSAFILMLFSTLIIAQKVPSPTQVFGFQPGADYKLADYSQLLDYYEKLDQASDRVQKVEIGKTALGKPMIMLIISSEGNLKQLDKWKGISEKLARAKISESEALKLSKEGKAIVWIDGGLHSNELAPGQMLPELAYDLATQENDEMKNIRENVVILLMPMMNPDGLDIVANWYRKQLGTAYETTQQPWLYHYYIGHDNNRDWFMNNMPETKNVSKIIYQEWFPQIVYNHHQPAPEWTKISIPPYSDPVNPKIHPAITAGVSEVGSAMAKRFALKRMPGAIADNYYTMFWNGGARTVPYYHNMIGILTETGHRSPTPRFYSPDSLPKLVGTGTPTDGTDIMYPYPWKGGGSHFRDALEYAYTASMATFNLAAERRTGLLYNIYSMGRDAIQAGEKDAPSAYIIPKSQWDSFEAINLVNILIRGGIEVQKAGKSFTAEGQDYEKGSYIIYTNQSFRPYLMDLLEKQDYPTRMQYPGGPPDTPYDLSGWTLPMQMGVKVDKVNSVFKLSSKEVKELESFEDGFVAKGAGFGYIMDIKSNASVIGANTILKSGGTVYKISEPLKIENIDYGAGSFIVKAEKKILDELADTYGIAFSGVSSKPSIKITEVHSPKVGLYKTWVANIDEGWTRWLLEQYAFDVDTLHDADMQGKDLSIYDAIILPSQSPTSILHGHNIQNMPEEYTGGLGLAGSYALDNYVKAGGVLLAFDAASDFVIEQLGLPLSDPISNLSSKQFFIPGSLIRSVVNTSDSVAYGMQDTVAVSFNRSRAFDVNKQIRVREGGREEIKDSPKAQVDVIARYGSSDLLMSGWAMGEDKYLAGKPAMVRVEHGEGLVYLYAFRPQFRGQSRGTYKLIFNAIYGGSME